MSKRNSRLVKTTGLVLLVVGVAAAVGTLVVRDQMARHRRNLFSSHALRRFAALGYIAGLNASVEIVHLLRDFVAWEPHRLLRRRARQILVRMEAQLEGGQGVQSANLQGEFAG